MMDIRDCTGRKVSLLNVSSEGVSSLPSKFQLPPPPPPPPLHSRASSSSTSSSSSSCSTTPSLSPRQTPQLVRSDSSDSRGLSPLTPPYNSFESAAKPLTPSSKHHHHARNQQHYYLQNHYSRAKMDDQNPSMYPPIPDATGSMPSAYAIPQHVSMQPHQQANPNQAFRASNSPASEPSRMSNVSAQSTQKPAQKKNQYPCPMAKQIGCTDFFTTSGHAARHAKKHTGKKDAFCPECNKAFTRKDNMEQHRRTHQNGRGSSRTSDDAKVKKTSKAPSKKSNGKSESVLEAAVQQRLDEQEAQVHQAQQAVDQAVAQQAVQSLVAEQPMLMPSSGPYYLGNALDSGPIPPLPMAIGDLNGRPLLHRTHFTNSLDYVAPIPPMIDPEALHYSYPSPGLSNGLNSLALAASEHQRRMSEKSQSSRSSSTETPDHKTP